MLSFWVSINPTSTALSFLPRGPPRWQRAHQMTNKSAVVSTHVRLLYKHVFILQLWCLQKQTVFVEVWACEGCLASVPAAPHANNSVIIDFISVPSLSALLHLFPLVLLLLLEAQQAPHILCWCKKTKTQQDLLQQTQLWKTLCYIFITLHHYRRI